MNIVLIAIFLTAAFTYLVTWWLSRTLHESRFSSLQARNDSLQLALDHQTTVNLHLTLQKEEWQQRAATAESRTVVLEEQLVIFQKLQQEYIDLSNQLATCRSELTFAEEKLAVQKEEVAQMGEQFRQEFRLMAQKIMDERTSQFTEVNAQKMNDILQPFKIQLGEFRQKVEETYDKESKERFSLGKEVERLINTTQQVSQEANNLTTALKGNNKIQGNWGEMILESILESSGMTRNREYFLQEFLKNAAGEVVKDVDGRGLQPDAVIFYPDQRKVIIDAKVSLIAWDACCAEVDVERQKILLAGHTRSIRQHIDGLAKKNYPRYAKALDYVLMFVPIEPAFIEALKSDHTLWKYAYDKKILLVSPTNLFAVLRIIADLWKVEQQSRHAIEIAEKAGALYDKFSGFMENFELIGRRLTEAHMAFDSAHKQIASGRGNITGKIEELKKMGANASKQLPDRLLLELEQ